MRCWHTYTMGACDTGGFSGAAPDFLRPRLREAAKEEASARFEHPLGNARRLDAFEGSYGVLRRSYCYFLRYSARKSRFALA